MELKKLYNLPHVNVLEYYINKLLTKAFLDKLKPNLNHYREMGSFLPTHLKTFFKSQKGVTDIYKVMNKSSVQPKMKVKWCQEMNEEIENFSESVLDSLVTPHSHGFNIDFCIEQLELENI